MLLGRDITRIDEGHRSQIVAAVDLGSSVVFQAQSSCAIGPAKASGNQTSGQRGIRHSAPSERVV